MNYFVCILIGYGLGTLNPAYWLSKAKGFDIRSKGSHNPGASNVTLTMGWSYGILTALFDIAKAAAAVLICRFLFPDLEIAGLLAGAASVVGHIFPFYLQFKGGKGYASYTGMMLAFNWKVALIMIVVGILITVITDYIALATIATVVIYPAYFWYAHIGSLALALLLFLAVLIIYRHKGNIANIIRHQEVGLRAVGKK